MSAPLLELSGISKNFGSVRALHEVDLSLQSGEIVGVMGDNGSGKSTLVKVVAGDFSPTTGIMKVNGNEIRFGSTLDARAVGIEAVYQDLALVDTLTVTANVFLGREITKKIGPFNVLDHWAMKKRILELFSDLKLEILPTTIVGQLSGGQRQVVAVARAKIANAKLLILDEPTAAISARHVIGILDLLRCLRDHGIAIILISHCMADVFSVCDRIVVMARGEKRADKPIARTDADEVMALLTGSTDVRVA